MLKKLTMLILSCLLFPLGLQAREKIIIDTDPAIGYPFRDVDDGLAMAIALNSPELEIVGITTVYGNDTQDKTYQKAQEIIKEAKSQVAIYRGAEGARQFGETPASKFIREAVLANPGEVTIIAIGPLTNLAAAIKSEPRVGPSIKQVISMGGALEARLLGLPPGAFDLNWGSDPDSTRIVILSAPKFVMISTDLCMEVVFTREKFAQLQSAPFLAPYLSKQVKPWLHFNELFFSTDQGRGFFPWDTLAVIYLLDPTVFISNPIQVEVRDRGGLGIKIETGQGTNINAPLKMDRDKFWEMFLSRV
jgi:inosine-uridine nucleoside N-ribohydrolase